MRFAASSLLTVCFAAVVSAGAAAQPAPPPAPAPIAVPTLAPVDPTTQAIVRAAAGIVNDIIARNRLNAENTTHGTVNFFRRYDMQVETGPNSYRDVRLRPGTIINPRGATPGNGTIVDISGRGQSDGSLEADVITVIR